MMAMATPVKGQVEGTRLKVSQKFAIQCQILFGGKPGKGLFKLGPHTSVFMVQVGH